MKIELEHSLVLFVIFCYSLNMSLVMFHPYSVLSSLCSILRFLDLLKGAQVGPGQHEYHSSFNMRLNSISGSVIICPFFCITQVTPPTGGELLAPYFCIQRAQVEHFVNIKNPAL